MKRSPLSAVKKFLALESASGILLFLCALIAMVLANSNFSNTYFDILRTHILGLSIHHWINDGLMAIFFFVVGMEIKSEMVKGELSTIKKAALPVAAAIGGMLGPGIIYLMWNVSGPGAMGWGIPMATDIAFAVGILSLFGKRVPLPLKIFLLALAIADDLGAVVLIAIFYAKDLSLLHLAAGACGLALMYGIRRMGVQSYLAYVIIGMAIWFAVLKSGVHATVAGVLIGLLTPVNLARSKDVSRVYSPIDELVGWLHPWVSFGVMPVFALANAGVQLSGVQMSEIVQSPIFLGVALGLLMGKPLGIMAASFLVVKLGHAELPRSIDWIELFGVALLGGIGFTMALFISSLALPLEMEVFSKMGILLGSMASAGAGIFILYFKLNPPRAV